MARAAFKSICFLSIFFLVSKVNAEAVTLNLLNWDEYISTTVLEKFKTETGISINVIHYASDASRDEVLTSPAAKSFDLVVIDNYSTRLFSRSKLLLDLSQHEIPNRVHLDSRWQHSCGAHGLPYFWGTLGIAYRADKLKSTPASWSDLLQPKAEYHGHIGMLLDAIDTLAPALKLAGHSMNSVSETELKSAFDLLTQQQPHVLTYQHGVSFLKSDAGSELYMALVFGGDQYAMNADEEGPWQYIIPREGTALWVDCLAVLSSSIHQKDAISFLDFLNRPEVAALNAEEVGSASANRAAINLLPDDIKNDHVLYPDETTLRASEEYQTLPAGSLRIREKIIEVLGSNED